jgi:hypothetical protein
LQNGRKNMNGVDSRIGDRIIRMRTFIDERFQDILMPGRDDGKMRTHAHDALNFLLVGNILAADHCMGKLDLKGAVDFRRKIGELDLLPKNQGQKLQG